MIEPCVETAVGNRNLFAIPLLPGPGLVPSYEQNGPPLGIEGKEIRIAEDLPELGRNSLRLTTPI